MVNSDCSAASEFIIRKANGLHLFAAAKNLGLSEVLIAGAFALRDGLQVAKFYGHSKILVEGDSKILIDNINEKWAIPWHRKSLVQDIKATANDFIFISFKHIYREANFVAYKITHLGHSVSSSSVWFNCLPFYVSPVFHLD